MLLVLDQAVMQNAQLENMVMTPAKTIAFPVSPVVHQTQVPFLALNA